MPRAEERNYVLMKRGLYWGPDFSGYVGVLSMAGRYTEAEARSRIDPEDDRRRPATTMHRVEDCPEFSPKCWTETQIEILRKERDEAATRAAEAEARLSALIAQGDANAG